MTKVPLRTDDVVMCIFLTSCIFGISAFPTTGKPQQALQEGYIMNPKGHTISWEGPQIQ
jgi:hypothetical protein